MDLLKKIFPLSWKFKGDTKSLLIGMAIYLVAGYVVTDVLTTISSLCILTLIFALLAIIPMFLISVVPVYVSVGIVLQILLHANVIKDEPVAEVEASAEEAEEAVEEIAE